MLIGPCGVWTFEGSQVWKQSWKEPLELCSGGHLKLRKISILDRGLYLIHKIPPSKWGTLQGVSSPVKQNHNYPVYKQIIAVQ